MVFVPKNSGDLRRSLFLSQDLESRFYAQKAGMDTFPTSLKLTGGALRPCFFVLSDHLDLKLGTRPGYNKKTSSIRKFSKFSSEKKEKLSKFLVKKGGTTLIFVSAKKERIPRALENTGRVSR